MPWVFAADERRLFVDSFSSSPFSTFGPDDRGKNSSATSRRGARSDSSPVRTRRARRKQASGAGTHDRERSFPRRARRHRFSRRPREKSIIARRGRVREESYVSREPRATCAGPTRFYRVTRANADDGKRTGFFGDPTVSVLRRVARERYCTVSRIYTELRTAGLAVDPPPHGYFFPT